MSYTAPNAKAGVYFTRNLTSDNYIRGVKLVRIYYDNSLLSKAPYYPVTNFDGAIAYLKNNYPTYIESLGELMNTIPEEKLVASMKEAAKKGRTDYPRPAYFSQAIINNTGYTLSAKIGDALEAVGEVGLGIGKFIWVACTIGVLIIAYVEFGPAIKALIKNAKAV